VFPDAIRTVVVVVVTIRQSTSPASCSRKSATSVPRQLVIHRSSFLPHRLQSTHLAASRRADENQPTFGFVLALESSRDLGYERFRGYFLERH